MFHCDLQKSSNDPDFFHSQLAECIPRQTYPYPDLQTIGTGRTSDALRAPGDFHLVQLRPVIPPIPPPLDLSTGSSIDFCSSGLPHQFTNDQEFTMSDRMSLVCQKTFGSSFNEETVHQPLFLSVNQAQLNALNRMHQQQRNQFYFKADNSGDNSLECFTKNFRKRRSFKGVRIAEGVETTTRQKNFINRLRKHLEKRHKESRPTTRIRSADALLWQDDRTPKDAEFCTDALCCSIAQRHCNCIATVPSFVDFPQEAKISHLNPLVKQNPNPEELRSDDVRLQMESKNAEISKKNTRTPSSIDSRDPRSSSLQRFLPVTQSTPRHSAVQEEFPKPSHSVIGSSEVIQSQRSEDRETNRRVTDRHRVPPNTGSMTEEVETTVGDVPSPLPPPPPPALMEAHFHIGNRHRQRTMAFFSMKNGRFE